MLRWKRPGRTANRGSSNDNDPEQEDWQLSVEANRRSSPQNNITVLISDPLVAKDNAGQLWPFPRLNFDLERDVIWQGLTEAKRDIELVYDTATYDRIQVAVMKKTTCLHYSGHGHIEYLPLEDGKGGPTWFEVGKFKRLIEIENNKKNMSVAAPPCRFVFVSACYSEPAGRAFEAAGVPHVVCCKRQHELKDSAAIQFSKSFYFALASGKTVRESFDYGRDAVLNDIESDKFMLLPEEANHDEKIFTAKPVSKWPDNQHINKMTVRNLIQEDPGPAPPHFFLGREVEMYRVITEVLSRRIVSIVGVRGVGRSSLVRSVCHYINERKTILATSIERIYFVNGRRYRTVSSIINKLLCLIIIDQDKKDQTMNSETNLQSKIDLLCRELKNIKALIVFDHIEEIPEHEGELNEFANFLQELCLETNGIKILLTNHVPLGIPSLGEHPIELGPLNLKNTVRLFTKCCRHLHTPAERKNLLDGVLSRVDGASQYDVNDTSPAKTIFELLGKGIPGMVESAAISIQKTELPHFLDGSFNFVRARYQEQGQRIERVRTPIGKELAHRQGKEVVSQDETNLVIDAYFAMQCQPSSLLHNLDGRPELLRDLETVCDLIKHASGPTGLLKRDYRLVISDCQKTMVQSTLQTSHVRVFFWCGRGIDECSELPEHLKVEAFGKGNMPEVVVVCMEFGARHVARLIYEWIAVSNVVWLCMDPYRDLERLFECIFLPFCASYLSCSDCLMSAEGLKQNLCKEFKLFKEEGNGIFSRDNTLALLEGSNIAIQRQLLRGEDHVCPEDQVTRCNIVFLDWDRSLKRLKVNRSDLEMLDSLKKALSPPEGDDDEHSFIFVNPSSPSEHDCKRSRALALYACYDIASRSTAGGFSDGIYRVASEDGKDEAKEKLLKGRPRCALFWVDFVQLGTAATYHFSDATDLKSWINDLSRNLTATILLSSDSGSLCHLKGVRKELVEGEHYATDITLTENPGGHDIPVDSLIGTFSIQPVDHTEGSCLLDIVDHPKKLADALKKDVFGNCYSNEDMFDNSLYRDDDGSVKVRFFVHDIKCITMLRDRILLGKAAEEVACTLNLDYGQVQFDPTAMVNVFEMMIMQLETLTEHQQTKMLECKRNTTSGKGVHIQGIAGSGKTFIALNNVLDFLESTPRGEVLFVSTSKSLGFYFCKWLCRRFGRRMKEWRRALKRIYLLTAEDPNWILSVKYDANRGLLCVDDQYEVTKKSFGGGMVVVDEAHDIFRIDEGAKSHRVREAIYPLLMMQHGCKSILLSDESQSSVCNTDIKYPTDGEWATVELTEACRCSKCILLGARSFQLGSDTNISFAHQSDGIPLRTLFFELDLTKGESELYNTYARSICQAISDVTEEFPGLDLHDRLAIIVPDDDFRTCLCGPLVESLKRSNMSFVPVTAYNSSRALNLARKSNCESSWIVVDTITNMDGLEKLIVFGVGLDASIKHSRASLRVACSRIYRTITRTQLLFYLINTNIEGGWFEWLSRRLETDTSAGKFSFDGELSKFSTQVASSLIGSIEEESCEGEKNFFDISSIYEKAGLAKEAPGGEGINEMVDLSAAAASASAVEKEDLVMPQAGIQSDRWGNTTAPNVQQTVSSRVWDTSRNATLRKRFEHDLLFDPLDPTPATLFTDLSSSVAGHSIPTDDWSNTPDMPMNNKIIVLFSAPLVYTDGHLNLRPFPQVDFEFERGLIWQCLKEAARDIKLSFDSASTDRFLRARCTCLHYCGHGHQRLLPFEDKGNVQWFSGEQLRKLMDPANESGGPSFLLVFVSAFYSEQVGMAFASAGVPHVVCCQQESELKDAAALAFTRQFYLSLALGSTVKESFDQGCKAVRPTPNLQDAEKEMKKFRLLPINGEHDVPMFNAKPSDEGLKVNLKKNSTISIGRDLSEVVQAHQSVNGGARTLELTLRNMIQEHPSPSPPQFFWGREVDMYQVLRQILEKRLVSVVGEAGIGRSSLVCALCHYINERASTMMHHFGRIYFVKARKDRRQNRSQALILRLMHKLVDTDKLEEPLDPHTDIGTLSDVVCKTLKNEKALVVFDHVDLLEDTDETNEFAMFLSRLLNETRNVKVLLTNRHPLNIPHFGEKSIELGPLNFGDTAWLFANLCPYVRLPTDRNKLFNSLMKATNEEAENLLPTDLKLTQTTIEIFSIIGGGIPSQIEKAAYNITKEDFLDLINGNVALKL